MICTLETQMREHTQHFAFERLPAPGVLASLLRSAERAGGGSAGRRPRVLLVEDDLVIGDMYALQLEMDGYEVHRAPDGNSGLNLIRTVKPDLVLLDIQLPHMDGFEVLTAVRADRDLAGTPVVILSNYGSGSMKERGSELGARAYMVKSQTTPDAVSARIPEWLRPKD